MEIPFLNQHDRGTFVMLKTGNDDDMIPESRALSMVFSSF